MVSIKSMMTALPAVSIVSAANCTREFLASATESYIQAQMHGVPATFARLFAPNATYAENDTPLDVQKGILNTAINIDRTHRYYDTTQCGAFAEVIAANSSNKTPYLIHTRFLFEHGPAAGITIVESVVTKPGDWAFNATGYLHYDGIESWPAIPPAQQDSRAVVQYAGDAYFDRFDNVSVVIPMASACARLEGGSYTARGNFSANTCEGYPSTILVTNRRYIVDEVYGVVDIFEGFPNLDRSVPKVAVPDSHLFRVEHGKIRYIHTVSHCINYNCGLNTTTFGR